MDKITLKFRKHKIFIDSEHFYSNNRKYYLGTLLFLLVQAMAFNSCCDIPALILILINFAFYAYRKTYTQTFLKYTFFVIYFIQVIIFLKLLNMIFRNIDFIWNIMLEYQNEPIVQANDILFGGLSSDYSKMTAREVSAAKFNRIVYVAFIFLCLASSQSWKGSK